MWGWGGLGQQGESRGQQGRKLRTDLLLVSPEINSGLKNFITKLVPARLAAGNPSGTSSRGTQGQKIEGCHWRDAIVNFTHSFLVHSLTHSVVHSLVLPSRKHFLLHPERLLWGGEKR